MSDEPIVGQLVAEDDKRVKAIRVALEGQHAIHGIFGSVFEKLGGEDFLLDWAVDNPGRFITLLTKMTPGLQPTQGFQGDLNLTVHESLGTTSLDDEI